MNKRLHIKTFGCQMNVYDSDRMEKILLDQGLVREDSLRNADVILINTCSIRDKAEHKVLSLLGDLKVLKRNHPSRVIGISGCVAQRIGRKLLQRAPHLDFVLGPDAIDRVGEVVEAVIQTGERRCEATLDGPERRYSQPVIAGRSKPAEFLTIMKGCDHFCTYCIVPFVRGREKSREVAEIVNDVRVLVEGGTQEVTFLGQNINTFGKGTGETLSQLIVETNKIQALQRIRYVTSHPRDLGEDLINQFGTIERLCPALHLPFQAGSDSVLKRMGRLYTRDEYLRKIALLRSACSDIAMSTDVIVGFPGETDDDFYQTLGVLRQVKFSLVFSFTYSPRPGTKAIDFEDNVLQSVKAARLAEVQRLTQKIIDEQNHQTIGKRIPILLEGIDRKGHFMFGRSPHNKIVHVLNAGPETPGRIIDVEICEANGSNLKGYDVGAERIIQRASSVVISH